MSVNPYRPVPMRIARTSVETDDQNLKSFELVFERESDQEQFFANYRPGQFCQLSLFGQGEAPFGVASAACEGDFVRITVNKIGLFTRAIHEMEAGDPIGMRGPLGNWYPIEDWTGANIVIIGGGYAFTTLYALTQHLLDPAVRPNYGSLSVIYGARNSGLFLYKSDIASWHGRDDIDLYQTIDNPEEGWDHLVGYVPTVTQEVAPSPKNCAAFVCGPPIMIKFTLLELAHLGFPTERIYTSLEKRMKCGIGKCGRCNVGHEYVCSDGPVFSFALLQDLPQDQ
ncbi:MAG: FAD/NAD(P)-binding protein [Anaerolineae bacterium]|nr:FAD/NAD(P)-binding protein [Anaerolineae bacterium]